MEKCVLMYVPSDGSGPPAHLYMFWSVFAGLGLKASFGRQQSLIWVFLGAHKVFVLALGLIYLDNELSKAEFLLIF